MVEAFFAAVTPAELEAWMRARDARHQADEALDRAEVQQIERLRYQALLAERQFNKVDPDNRNVAGELEHRWELALRDLRQAEDALARHRAERSAPETLSDGDRERFLTLGPQLPALWEEPGMTRERRKALLRKSDDKVVLRRAATDRISVRIVWRGGAVSDLEVAVAVYTHRVLPRGAEMEARLLDLARQGFYDATIAAQLTTEGQRSARCGHVPVDTVRHIREFHRVLRDWRRTHPPPHPGMADHGRAGQEASSLPRLDRATYPKRQDRHRPRCRNAPIPGPGHRRNAHQLRSAEGRHGRSYRLHAVSKLIRAST